MLRITNVEMLPLETKEFRDKLLPHLVLRGGVFLEEVSRSRKRNRDTLLGTWNVRRLYRAGSLMTAARSDGRIILRWIFRNLEGIVGTGWSWLRIVTDGGLLCVR
jgi:hypothetical protein